MYIPFSFSCPLKAEIWRMTDLPTSISFIKLALLRIDLSESPSNKTSLVWDRNRSETSSVGSFKSAKYCDAFWLVCAHVNCPIKKLITQNTTSFPLWKLVWEKISQPGFLFQIHIGSLHWEFLSQGHTTFAAVSFFTTHYI